MPVIVVGADTPHGSDIIDALLDREGQVRAFVTDEAVAADLKAKKVKVATGDVSDASHVEAASTRCFSAVLLTTAAVDDRERHFAPSDLAVLKGWADGLDAKEVTRAIWVLDEAHADWEPPERTPDHVVLHLPAAIDGLAAEVARLDDAAEL
jgi:putative NADH-flavin reductase